MDPAKLEPVYPQAPPAYAEATAAPSAPPHIQQIPQPQMMPQQPVYVVQQAPEIVVIQNVKIAPSYEPYLEFCPRCQKNVTTRIEYSMGFCSWTMFFLGIFVFFPLLCCFCLDSFKDARHHCPDCGTILAIKRR